MATQVHMLDGDLLDRQINVVLVGAGGTGSHMLRRLANIHIAMTELGHPGGLKVTVYDPDTVSKTNVGRQNFYPSDVGQSKANILVNRLNMQLLTAWKAVTELVTDSTQFERGVDIVIGAVDSRKARKAILEAITRTYNSRPTYWLDLGNREHDGQYVLGQVLYKGMKTFPNRLPHVAELMPEIIDASLDANDETPSCSLAEALSKQSLFINDTMANHAASMLWELFRHGQIKHHGQFVNIKSGRVMPLSVDQDSWKRFGFDAKASPKRRRTKAVNKQ